jgi:hypothetical protein
MVEEGELSEAMDKCGTYGFNICKVSYGDYEKIIEWDKIALPPPPSVYEYELRSYIV